MATQIIDPVTRIEGHLKVKVTIDTVSGKLQVVDAWSSGTLFRGLENVLIKRHPWDAQQITQRMCGVCPVPHSMASVLALQQAGNHVPPNNATLIRNLVLAANFLDSHILHFYHLSAPDYIDGPAMPPWQPSWSPDKRIDTTTTAALVQNYVNALDVRRKAHEMAALLGGKMPHPSAFMPAGVTTTPRADRIAQFRSNLAEVTDFINNVYLNDVAALAGVYGDHFDFGAGYGNLLSFGVFGGGPTADADSLFKRGLVINGASDVSEVNTRAIAEDVKYSWYDDATDNLKPSAGQTKASHPKNSNAYSWSKAPRYNGRAFEAGPLSRMWVNGEYRNGISVMDRHAARAKEASKLAAAMPAWLDQIDVNGPVYPDSATVPATGVGEGITEAPRGAIGHWLRIVNSRIANYQVITPSCWNLSPRDSADKRGPLEEALVGTPITDESQPIEVLRVIHSFDPCQACAVHVMRPGKEQPIAVLRLA
jgi:hydrogenase large subunit